MGEEEKKMFDHMVAMQNGVGNKLYIYPANGVSDQVVGEMLSKIPFFSKWMRDD